MNNMAFITPTHLKLLVMELSRNLQENADSQEIADCVIGHAAAASVAAMAGGVFSGFASLIASGIAIGAIWRMYIKLCQILNINLKKDILKSVASAVLSNIVTQIGGMILAEVLIGFIPGASVLVCGVVNFVVVYFAGLIFIKTLTSVFKAGNSDFENISADALKENAKAAANDINTKDIIKEAKSAFKDMKKDGSLNDAGESVDISQED